MFTLKYLIALSDSPSLPTPNAIGKPSACAPFCGNRSENIKFPSVLYFNKHFSNPSSLPSLLKRLLPPTNRHLRVTNRITRFRDY